MLSAAQPGLRLGQAHGARPQPSLAARAGLRPVRSRGRAALTIVAEAGDSDEEWHRWIGSAERRGRQPRSGGWERDRQAAPSAGGSSTVGGRRRSSSSGSSDSRGGSQSSAVRGRRSGSSGSSNHSSSGASSRHPNGRSDRSNSHIQGPEQQQQGPWQDLKPLMAALDSCASCSEVLQVVLQTDAAAGQRGVHIFVLSKALDTMKKKATCEGGSEAADRRAVAQLLQLAVERLADCQPRELSAFVRCAAAFPGVLQPQQLQAWQAVLQQHKPLDANAQAVSNMLLALGTLVQSDGKLAAVVSQLLAAQLLQHAVVLASHGELGPLQPVGNTLYGAALLGLQPSAAQMQQLFSAVQQALQQPLHPKNHVDVTQILLACAQLCDVEAAPGTNPTPAKNPFHRCYPGTALVDALLERAVCSRLGAQAASQIVNACGRLLHMPAPEHWAALLAAFSGDAHHVTCTGASAIMMGCAQLHMVPPAATVEACVAAVEQQNQRSNGREAANMAWALAMLQACDLPTWQRLVTVIAQEGASLAELDCWQLAQAHMLMQLRHGDNVPCPPGLLQRSRVAWKGQLQQQQQEHQQLQGRSVSRLEALLTAAVAQLAGGCAVEGGHIVHSSQGEPLLQADIALPQLRIAVEADGPRHFIRNAAGPDGQPLLDGPTQARNRLLRHHGWHVVGVPYWVFNAALQTSDPQAALLAHLRQHTDLVPAIAERAGTVASAD